MRVSVSHPFDATPSQSAKPALQLSMRHAPATHEPLALALLQRVPHPPQLLASVASAASHPSMMLLLQFSNPNAQTFVHVPAEQTVCEQLLPHAPQLAPSDAVSTHTPPQQA